MIANPSTATELLKSVQFENLIRSSARMGGNYYKHRLIESVKVIIRPPECKLFIIIPSHVDNGIKKEELFLDFNEGTIAKCYRESSCLSNPYRTLTYPIVYTEEEHFMQSTIQDTFFPEFEDFVQLHNLYNILRVDAIEWNEELMVRRIKRKNENLTYLKNIGRIK